MAKNKNPHDATSSLTENLWVLLAADCVCGAGEPSFRLVFDIFFQGISLHCTSKGGCFVHNDKSKIDQLGKIAAVKQERRKIADLHPAEYNPRKHLRPGDEEYERLKRSIETFGYVDPIIVNSDGTVIGGHQRLFVLQDLGYSEADVAVVDLNKQDEKALNIALNKISGEWDQEKLANIFAELGAEGYDLEVTGFDKDEQSDVLDAVKALNDSIEDERELSDKYTKKIKNITYEVTGETPDISELFDRRKANELIMDIESDMTISEEEREFLKLAAMRHVVFDYRNIAEYYAAASPEMQGLMEDSALVIIDIDQAITNGYARLKGSILDMVEREGSDDDEA